MPPRQNIIGERSILRMHQEKQIFADYMFSQLMYLAQITNLRICYT